MVRPLDKIFGGIPVGSVNLLTFHEALPGFQFIPFGSFLLPGKGGDAFLDCPE